MLSFLFAINPAAFHPQLIPFFVWACKFEDLLRPGNSAPLSSRGLAHEWLIMCVVPILKKEPVLISLLSHPPSWKLQHQQVTLVKQNWQSCRLQAAFTWLMLLDKESHLLTLILELLIYINKCLRIDVGVGFQMRSLVLSAPNPQHLTVNTSKWRSTQQGSESWGSHVWSQDFCPLRDDLFFT